MIIIGVTGNSGAGKTTVSTIMKNNLNAPIVNADIIAREQMEEGKDYYNSVLKMFGKEILNTSKNKTKINRAKIAKIIFVDKQKRDELNKLTFKFVGNEMKKKIMEYKEQSQEYLILDVPLLYESKFNKVCNYVIAVIADEKTKVERLRVRDKLPSDEDAINRIHSQKDEEFYKENANFIIRNDKNVKYIELVKQTLSVIHKIKDEKKD